MFYKIYRSKNVSITYTKMFNLSELDLGHIHKIANKLNNLYSMKILNGLEVK